MVVVVDLAKVELAWPDLPRPLTAIKAHKCLEYTKLTRTARPAAMFMRRGGA